MEELKRLAEVRDRAAEELRARLAFSMRIWNTCLSYLGDVNISTAMNDYWSNQNAGSESEAD